MEGVTPPPPIERDTRYGSRILRSERAGTGAARSTGCGVYEVRGGGVASCRPGPPPPRARPPVLSHHTSAYDSIRQHTSAYVSIRQHTASYVSIRHHTSAYGIIRQHTLPHCLADSGRRSEAAGAATQGRARQGRAPPCALACWSACCQAHAMPGAAHARGLEP